MPLVALNPHVGDGLPPWVAATYFSLLALLFFCAAISTLMRDWREWRWTRLHSAPPARPADREFMIRAGEARDLSELRQYELALTRGGFRLGIGGGMIRREATPKGDVVWRQWIDWGDSVRGPD